MSAQVQSEALPQYKRSLGDIPCAGVNYEFELLRCLAVPNSAAYDPERARQIISGGVNWERLFIAMAVHGVFPAVFKSFKGPLADVIPAIQLERFNTHYARTMRLNMSLIATFVQFHRRLQQLGIPSVIFKGPAVASQMYGDAFAREFSDIDVLVHRENAAAAQQILIDLGYVAADELPIDKEYFQTKEFFLLTHEHTYKREQPRGIVDLHWHVQPRHHLNLDNEYVFSNTVPIRLEGTECNTLSPELAFLLNSAHAGKHQFQRMLWAADTARMIMRTPAIDWSHVIELAQLTGSVRAVVISVILANHLFETPGPDSIKQLAGKREYALCDEIATNMKTFDLTPNGSFFYPLIFHLALKKGVLQKASFFAEELFKPTLADVARLPLAPQLTWLYTVLRPYWILKDAFGARLGRSIRIRPKLERAILESEFIERPSI